MISRKQIGFIASIIVMIVVYGASSSPIPLYSNFQSALGISKASLSLTAVTYFLGTVISLLFFGRVSNYIGRRKTILITILMAIIGCLSFIYINSFEIFLVARLVQGISCGLASSCVAAYMVDTTPNESSTLSAIVTSGCTMIGLTFGSFSSAVLMNLSLSTVFVLIIILLVISAILIVLGEETVEVHDGVLSSIKPYVEFPSEIRYLLIPASAIFVGTWAVGGFYQAFSSTIAVDQFGVKNAILAAAIFSSLMAPQILGNTLIKYISNVKAQRLGMVLFSVSMILIVVSFEYKLVWLFLILSILAAIFIGISFASTMEIILSKIKQSQRAGVLSTIYLISYGGPAIINLIVGQIGNAYTLIEITVGYTLFVLFTTLITIIFTRN
ncbi:MFS transporter [uncultured Methanobrevibacter sp.]|uniref:MFS transporter n=1 Tax=uncultured Methanobrevibacter sp. TaxID=253161 RepID=UPI00261A1419|nr:MFS transporter [uncultured Methanobrevibacter sp.]